jgi:hypothetical protein
MALGQAVRRLVTRKRPSCWGGLDAHSYVSVVELPLLGSNPDSSDPEWQDTTTTLRQYVGLRADSGRRHP